MARISENNTNWELRPFPYNSWPRVSLSECEGHNALLSALSAKQWGSIESKLEQLLHLQLRLSLNPEHSGERTNAEMQAYRIFGPMISLVEANGSVQPPMYIELEPTLAGLIVDRALGGRGDIAALYAASAMSEFECGALAFVAANLLIETPYRVFRVAHSDGAAPFPLEDRFPYVFRAVLDGYEGYLRVWLCPSRVAGLQKTKTDSSPLPYNLPLCVFCWVGDATLGLIEAQDLAPGDVVMLDQARVKLHQRHWHGSLPLVVFSMQTKRFVQIALVTLSHRGLVANERIAAYEDPAMASQDHPVNPQSSPQQNLHALDDVPVRLEVTIAEFTMPLSALSSLEKGQILKSPVKIGETAKLYANGACIALGELVDVDGAVGFRIKTLSRS